MEDHKLHKYNLTFSVITVSTTRTKENDESGKVIIQLIQDAKYKVTHYEIVKDDIVQIRRAFFYSCNKSDVIIFNGGTGISKLDQTPEAIIPYLKILPGFGEIFRFLSYQEIGTSAIMSRATAGIYNDKIIFLLPGSPNACKLAVEKIILNEANHIYYEINKEKI
ncbi:MAG: MogA/MoaB family molybdenum cofactor biosynthesis protein [Thermoplasmata archaeon]|nr:MogA/MoaB family molybdenum cofactor biosynthesis protein [Thermoplasmata archaeon]